MCNLQTRSLSETTRDQVDDFTNQLDLSRGIPCVSLNFMQRQEVEKIRANFFHVKCGQ